MKPIRIFISSPGDVAEERQTAGKVIERLQGKYWSFVRLDDVFWETQAVRATSHFQDELVNPGDCEIVVGIFWSRLGSVLPEKFRKEDGLQLTGTEWELEEAFHAYESRKSELIDDGASEKEASTSAKPDILIYRRNEKVAEWGTPEEKKSALHEQEKLNRYFKENYYFPDGTIKRPILNYDSVEEFEKKLQSHLEQRILGLIPGLQPGFERHRSRVARSRGWPLSTLRTATATLVATGKSGWSAICW